MTTCIECGEEWSPMRKHPECDEQIAVNIGMLNYERYLVDEARAECRYLRQELARGAG